MARAVAAGQIQGQIARGQELARLDHRSVTSDQEWFNAEGAVDRWCSFVAEMLARMFDTPWEVERFESVWAPGVPSGSGTYDYDVLYYDRVKSCLSALTSLRERLDLIPEVAPAEHSAAEGASSRTTGRRVFVVHGHDREGRERVARVISKIGFEPVIIAEQPTQGMTIIELLEKNAREVVFSVVLLTPDDVGRAASAPPGDLRPRARQNVLLELGYFVARLGRGRVCALLRGEIEIPSDFGGVLWIPFDDNDAWPLRVCKEMQAAGLDVDLNRL